MSRMVEYDYLLERAKNDPGTRDNPTFFKSLRTVDAEPVKRGHWVKESFLGYIGSIDVDENGEPVLHECLGYYCSECGRYEHEIQPYCNCGAKMDEEVHDGN